MMSPTNLRKISKALRSASSPETSSSKRDKQITSSACLPYKEGDSNAGPVQFNITLPLSRIMSDSSPIFFSISIVNDTREPDEVRGTAKRANTTIEENPAITEEMADKPEFNETQKPSLSLVEPSFNQVSPETCSICQQPFSNQTVIVPCGHAFDFNCLRRWALDTPRRFCPICKVVMTHFKRASSGRMCELANIDASDEKLRLSRKADDKMVHGAVNKVLTLGSQRKEATEIVSVKYPQVRYLTATIDNEDFVGTIRGTFQLNIRQAKAGTRSSVSRRLEFRSHESSGKMDIHTYPDAQEKYKRSRTELLNLWNQAQRKACGTEAKILKVISVPDMHLDIHDDGEWESWTKNRKQVFMNQALRTGQLPPTDNHPTGFFSEIDINIIELRLTLTSDYLMPNSAELAEEERVRDGFQQIQGALKWLRHWGHSDDELFEINTELTDLLERAEKMRCRFCNEEGLHEHGYCLLRHFCCGVVDSWKMKSQKQGSCDFMMRG